MPLAEQVWSDYREDPKTIQRKWKTSAFRTYGLLAGLPRFSAARHADIETVLWPCFLRTAVVNVIKTTGRKEIADSELLRLARDDWPEVETQLRKLKPHIVICCGTFPVAMEHVLGNGARADRAHLAGWFWSDSQALFLRASHPQRGAFRRAYNEVRRAVREATRSGEGRAWWRELQRRADLPGGCGEQHLPMGVTAHDPACGPAGSMRIGTIAGGRRRAITGPELLNREAHNENRYQRHGRARERDILPRRSRLLLRQSSVPPVRGRKADYRPYLGAGQTVERPSRLQQGPHLDGPRIDDPVVLRPRVAPPHHTHPCFRPSCTRAQRAPARPHARALHEPAR